mmetsp:Transcript_34374/g.33576  ORF Transcript_34374/g.33576 Transcript_34374/m.33576 type:complete len:209 (-) Transcript_34374:227-853(-)|eukprot:CAMPEP_0170562384 /NCGR_PEP_ID=MMETSP0211-20121228/60188_1 /TAXON_ID=311385 /ORGANISM="Pseudokeronopsis sp., Strain OXSARD2" /LENGTH=208 /DNA_ID=CAMNT_0010879175 /DNA_START=86 /DNA_END=712 /DNA_ORIENTATION=+
MMYTVANWIELSMLVFMTYKLKDIKDEFSIRNEIITISLIWFIFSFLYIGSRYMSAASYSDVSDQYFDSQVANWIFFLAELFSNFCRIFVSTVFCIQELRKYEGSYLLLIPDSIMTMMDFDTVIVSVLPFSTLDSYIQTKKPDYLPYWKVMQLLKILSSLEIDEKEASISGRYSLIRSLSSDKNNILYALLQILEQNPSCFPFFHLNI